MAFAVIVICAAPVLSVVLASVCEFVVLALPVSVSPVLPLPRVRTLVGARMFVAVALKFNPSVPPVTSTPPVKVLAPVSVWVVPPFLTSLILPVPVTMLPP